ncbi:hypothetical protein [Vibrio mangrovi]|uniref:Uncharacterized protein n=1 Tax=Vibrio mangrovi TaxID=474394 RepID=A0A1Y6IQ58_9VIBR|nr:hypothetical protein [Vibrio mangrovi]MDW6004002.1 hypothetical protein [Vibrio mangrovi]SMR99201.1 hypothetical protein VIM7927_00425 [Vibrio mangrovi]
MPVSHVKGDFCKIEGFKPSSQTTDAINRMNEIIDMSGVLEKLLMGVPVYQIFAGRDTYISATIASIGYNVTTYDWQLFADSVKSVGKIRRVQLEKIANEMALFSIGKEYKFWRCVGNAL